MWCFKNTRAPGLPGLRALPVASLFGVEDEALHGIPGPRSHQAVEVLAVIVLEPVTSQAILLVGLNGRQSSVILVVAALDSFQMLLSPMGLGMLGPLKTNNSCH